MATLGTKTRYVSMIIHDSSHFCMQEYGNLEKLISWLKANSTFYALCYHDQDMQKDDINKRENHHTHIVFLALKTEKSTEDKPVFPSLRTQLNRVEEVLHCGPTYIQMDKAANWITNLRYLLHMDEVLPCKHHYDRHCLVTNDEEMYDNWIMQDDKSMNAHRLYKIVVDSNYSLFDIISIMGVDEYRKYRLVIADIVKSHNKHLEN